MIETTQRIERLAAAVAETFDSGMIIGLGSGSTAEAVVRALGHRMTSERRFAISGVATSQLTASLARSLGINIVDLDSVSRIDIGFDGADEIDPQLNLVKGKGGALLYEKLVAEICDDYVVVSSDEKLVPHLGVRLPLPVEVIPYGAKHTAARLESLGLTPHLRMSDGITYVTDAGNHILDCRPGSGIDLLETAPAIKATTGVVEHGVFAGFARRAMLVDQEGRVTTR